MTGEVGLHTDHAQLKESPNVVAFHCIQQACSGGESLFCDGFHIAKTLADKSPADFQLLCQTDIEYVGWGTEVYKFHHVNRTPIFKLNEKCGMVERVTFGDDRRNWYFNGEVETISKVYQAMKLFMDCCYQSENVLKAKMEPGDIVLFLNNRILHGREAYESQPDKGLRYFEGCEFTTDVICSKIRVLQEKLGKHQEHDSLI